MTPIEEYNTNVSLEERKKNCSKGGKKSAENKKARKKLSEDLIAMLENGDTQINMCLSIMERALNGDIKAFEVIRDTIGEKPTDKVDMTANLSYEEKLKEITDKDEY